MRDASRPLRDTTALITRFPYVSARFPRHES